MTKKAPNPKSAATLASQASVIRISSVIRDSSFVICEVIRHFATA
jgi:hypothetical protein